MPSGLHGQTVAKYAGQGQVARCTVWPVLPSITGRSPKGSASFASDSYGFPSPPDGPNRRYRPLTGIGTFDGVSTTFVTLTLAPGPDSLPARSVCSSTTR